MEMNVRDDQKLVEIWLCSSPARAIFMRTRGIC